MTRETIFKEISEEREYQDQKWGGAKVDDLQNGPMEWVGYIAKHSTFWFPGGFPPWSPETIKAFRKSMVNVAALAVAAIEQADRGA